MSARPSRSDRGSADTSTDALRSLIRATRGVFCKPLRVERCEGRLQVALDAREGTARTVSPSDSAVTSPEVQVRLMFSDLRSHLDRCGDARTALPHLAAVEQGLGRRGMRAFDDLPLPLLKRASGQVQASAQEPILEGLALLQARLDLTIVTREEVAQALRKSTREGPSSFFVDHKLQVNEVTLSEFQRVASESATTLTDATGIESADTAPSRLSAL